MGSSVTLGRRILLLELLELKKPTWQSNVQTEIVPAATDDELTVLLSNEFIVRTSWLISVSLKIVVQLILRHY